MVSKEICENCGQIHLGPHEGPIEAGEEMLKRLDSILGNEENDFHNEFKIVLANTMKGFGGRLNLQNARIYKAGILSIITIIELNKILHKLGDTNKAILAGTLASLDKMIAELEAAEKKGSTK